ncbi:hypothetical protein [Hymenobacter cellulosilyticus]|uniref:Uncharacterized protein n=1 Tax=Hymenobacter cellulosilyticus TaxID=2932248 RepID=A0A8T9QEV7_9BACT|nr:hypothetical protein [Hymenobacter cellulosilyticus]UOQ74698.1 hypothetical protein MUN79_12975 [Hymenobacter cellulosilyticus]
MARGWFVFLAILVAGLVFSCHQKPPLQPKRYEYYTTYVTPYARLALTPRQDSSDVLPFTYYEYTTEPGDKLVFELVYEQGDSTHEDAGAAETAVFEIPDTATSFRIRDREFLAHQGLWIKTCFCFEPTANKARKIDSGNQVAGRQLTPFTWLIHSEIVGINFTDTIDIRTKNVVDRLK